MFERLSRSWDLVKASAAVLREDKELLLFPVMSSVATLLVMAAFLLPMIGLGALDGMGQGRVGIGAGSAGVWTTGKTLLAFLFYITQYFVIFYFNTALVGAAMKRLEGGNPTLGDGLAIANSRLASILGYALIAATVGMILRALQERANFIGKIIVGLIGMGWTLATYMVVPVLAARNVGPIEAVKESALLLKKTWGENVIGQAGMTAAFVFIYMAAAVLAAVVLVAAIASKSAVLIVPAGIAVIVGFLLIALIQSALAGIYSAALYRYATSGEGSAHFDKTALQAAFGQK
ncbi:MAG: hypothetical protein JNK75_00340 [Betaproteobacteria bacterium]|nr:hypothetical protein [Betaproteobacteria bacterium]